MRKILSAALILVFCQFLAYYMGFQQQVLVESAQVQAAHVSAGPALGYFFGMVAGLASLLFLARRLHLAFVLKGLIGLAFCAGAFAFLSLWLPLAVSAAVSAAVGIAWFLASPIWFHDLLMCLTAATLSSYAGLPFSPWTLMVVMLVIALYDVLAVRFGLMTWMAGRLLTAGALPAFIIPQATSGWFTTVKKAGLGQPLESRAENRKFAVLGGGDVIFPVLLAVSALYAYGTGAFVIIGMFSIIGLFGAFWMQRAIFKGAPTPALPPIAIACLVGLMAVYLTNL